MSLAWTTDPLWLVINALMTFRLTHAWIEDKLPPLPWLREKIQEYALRDSGATGERFFRYQKRVARYEQPPLLYLIDCYGCAGYWISLAVFLGASLVPLAVWAFLAVPLAVSAAVMLTASRI